MREMPVFRLTITRRDTATLTAWDSVVPRAAPMGPRCMGPMKRRSRPMLTTQATAMKYMGLLLSPSPRKMELRML